MIPGLFWLLIGNSEPAVPLAPSVHLAVSHTVEESSVGLGGLIHAEFDAVGIFFGSTFHLPGWELFVGPGVSLVAGSHGFAFTAEYRGGGVLWQTHATIDVDAFHADTIFLYRFGSNVSGGLGSGIHIDATMHRSQDDFPLPYARMMLVYEPHPTVMCGIGLEVEYHDDVHVRVPMSLHLHFDVAGDHGDHE